MVKLILVLIVVNGPPITVEPDIRFPDMVSCQLSVFRHAHNIIKTADKNHIIIDDIRYNCVAQ